jgi:acetyl-CoA synthetase
VPWATIHKARWPGGVVPNVVDYDAARATFSWTEARRRLDGLPRGRGLNIAHEAVDRNAAGPQAARVALRWIARDRSVTEATYAELASRTNRFANVLRGLGVGKGDRVFTLLGRVPELYVTVLGALKNTSVFCPLFSAFGPEPIFQRLERGDGRVLVTTPTLYRRKVASVRDALPLLEHVILVGGHATDEIDCALDFDVMLAASSDEFELPPTDPEDMALLLSPAARRARPKGRCRCTTPSSPTTPPAHRPSTCTPTTCSGAPPTLDG